MRQSKLTKVTALMLSMVMITSVFVGNTLSRYVTSVSSTDSARVAIWGINGGTTTMELFNTAYDLDGKKIAEANLNEDGTTRDKIIAPGTGGSSAFSIINYENEEIPPEVAYQVTINLDDSQVDEKIVNNTSIQWKLDNNAWGTFEQLKTSLLSLSGHESGSFNYMPGTFADAFKGDIEHKIYWQWILDGNNEIDTQMGNDALISDIGVKIFVTITAQQTDDLITNENLLDGANQIVNLNDVQTLTLRSASDIANFQSVNVNGNAIDPSNYTTKSGSTIVELKKEYLSTLAVGSYTIDIVSTDMVASTRFMVKEAPIVHNEVIPEGGIYYVGVQPTYNEDTWEYYNYVGDYSFEDRYTDVYTEGNKFPEPQIGDVYVYGDYEYRYGMELLGGDCWIIVNSDGWGVALVDQTKTKSEYDNILTNINEKDVISLIHTFEDCKYLKEMPVIPETVINIEWAFCGCESLTVISEIPESVKYMVGTFYNTSIVKAPKIPNGVENLEVTFEDCKNLEVVPEIPDSVTDMIMTFAGCTSLVNAPVIPSSVTNIMETFRDSGITGTIEINSNPTMYENALAGTGITEIIGLTTMANEIAESSGITLIYNGENLEETGVYYVGVDTIDIGDYSDAIAIYKNGMFPEIINIGDIYVYGDYEYRYNMEYDDGNSFWNINKDQNGWGVRVLDDSKEEYSEILTTINGKNVVNLDWAFSNCMNLIKAPVIPINVISMVGTFAGCESLKQAPVLPTGLKDLYLTFASCYSLEEAPIIPEGVVDLDDTFLECTSLKKPPVIPNSVKYMVDTFAGCTSLDEAPEIPNGVIDITNAFADCISLVQAPVIPESVISMYDTFRNCENLTGSIEINSDPIDAYYGALAGTQITEITGTTTLKDEILASRYDEY